MPDTGIVQAKNIIRAIKQKHDFDFSHLALTAFRFALDRSMCIHNLKYPEMLETKILEDDDFFDEFLFEMIDETLELFRDPDTWIVLKSIIFPEFFKTFNEPKIWIPGANNGQDLFSLLILLKIDFPGENINLDISSVSEKTIENISHGTINSHVLISGLENFKKIFPKADLYSFLKPDGTEYLLENLLFQGINCRKQNLLFEPHPGNAEMIIFRNNLLNYSQEQQNNILKLFMSILKKDGYLVIGIKENIDDYILKYNNLQLVDMQEKIYKKIT